MMGTLQWLVRLAPPNTPGKQRLFKSLLSRNARSRAAFFRDREGNAFHVPNLLEPVALHLWTDGVYEPETLAFLHSVLNAGDVFLDVGANIGAFAISLARRVGPAGRVVAIEASPVIGGILSRNIGENQLSNILMLNCAASNGGSDHVDFYEAPLDHFGMGSSAPQFGALPIRVPAMSLDKILEAHSVPKVTAIKVDVEGYEAHVFSGAQQTLTQDVQPPIIFEFCDWAEDRAFPGKCGWAQSILQGFGYSLWTLNDYVSGGAPLKEPLTKGTETIVAVSSEIRSR
jgi:FkbM family methyltransferase